jgi:hypothetical protein
MAIFSNVYFFPVFQAVILMILLFALWRDYRPKISSGFSGTLTRGPQSMTMLEKTTGLVIAAIITIVNKSVFDDPDAGWRHYSASVNLFDLCAIIYFCYVSSFGRNLILGINNRLREERV